MIRTLDLGIPNAAPWTNWATTRLSLWSFVELNHVLRIFSPAHTPSLPKLHLCYREGSNLHFRLRRPASCPLDDRSNCLRKQKDSNLRGGFPPASLAETRRRPLGHTSIILAEAVGLEPTTRCRAPVFKTGRLPIITHFHFLLQRYHRGFPC